MVKTYGKSILQPCRRSAQGSEPVESQRIAPYGSIRDYIEERQEGCRDTDRSRRSIGNEVSGDTEKRTFCRRMGMARAGNKRVVVGHHAATLTAVGMDKEGRLAVVGCEDHYHYGGDKPLQFARCVHYSDRKITKNIG